MKMRRIFAAVIISTAALCPAGAADKIFFAENFSHGISNGWQNVPLYKSPTTYKVASEGTNFWLRAEADNSCSAFTGCYTDIELSGE